MPKKTKKIFSKILELKPEKKIANKILKNPTKKCL